MQQPESTLFLWQPRNLLYLNNKVARPFFEEWSARDLWLGFGTWTVLLVLFLGLVIPAWKQWFDFRNVGIDIEGEMIDYRIASGDDYFLTVLYRYTVNEQVFRNEQKVPIEQLKFIQQVQSTISVRYFPYRPDISELGEPYGNYGDLREQGTVLGVSFFMMMLGVLIYQYDRHTQNSLLVSNATVIKGTIVSAFGEHKKYDGFFWKFVRNRPSPKFVVRITYKITSPKNQKELTRSESAVRNDMNPKSIPYPGQPLPQ